MLVPSTSRAAALRIVVKSVPVTAFAALSRNTSARYGSGGTQTGSGVVGVEADRCERAACLDRHETHSASGSEQQMRPSAVLNGVKLVDMGLLNLACEFGRDQIDQRRIGAMAIDETKRRR